MTVSTRLSSSRGAAQLGTALALAALLGACSSQPRISAQQESSQYRAHAGRTYTPPGPASDPWGPHILEAAAKFDVPERWVREVMRQESGGHLYGRGGDLITSGAGAMGLMQVMPATYDEIHGRYPELGDDPYDPHNNILAGTAYIREMYDIYGSPGFLAAYNAGPGRLDDYLTRNRTLPEETRRYVAAIGPRIAGAEPRTASPGQQYAMSALPYSIPDGTRYATSSRYSAPAKGSSIAVNPAPIQLAAAQPLSAPVPQPAPESQQQAQQFAQAPIVLQPQAQPIVLRPQPIEVAEVPDAPAPRYTPTAVPFQVARATESTRYVPAAYAPPAYVAPRTQQQYAAASLVPVAPRGFHLIAQAHAEPIGAHHQGGTSGNWAVQVGALANEGLAASAIHSARDNAYDVLASAHGNVTPVRQAHGTLYRARLGGLSHDAAAQACQRLARARTTCMVISPDAQS